jgi:uncharacterized integral membrane protein
MRAVFWVFVLVLAAILAVFAASNRESVSLAFWPLPFLFELPLYVLVFGALVVGFVLGELTGWLAGRRWRREVRRCGRRIAALERELSATQAQLAPPPVPVRAAAPAVRA